MSVSRQEQGRSEITNHFRRGVGSIFSRLKRIEAISNDPTYDAPATGDGDGLSRRSFLRRAGVLFAGLTVAASAKDAWGAPPTPGDELFALAQTAYREIWSRSQEAQLDTKVKKLNELVHQAGFESDPTGIIAPIEQNAAYSKSLAEAILKARVRGATIPKDKVDVLITNADIWTGRMKQKEREESMAWGGTSILYESPQEDPARLAEFSWNMLKVLFGSKMYTLARKIEVKSDSESPYFLFYDNQTLSLNAVQKDNQNQTTRSFKWNTAVQLTSFAGNLLSPWHGPSDRFMTPQEKLDVYEEFLKGIVADQQMRDEDGQPNGPLRELINHVKKTNPSFSPESQEDRWYLEYAPALALSFMQLVVGEPVVLASNPEGDSTLKTRWQHMAPAWDKALAALDPSLNLDKLRERFRSLGLQTVISSPTNPKPDEELAKASDEELPWFMEHPMRSRIQRDPAREEWFMQELGKRVDGVSEIGGQIVETAKNNFMKFLLAVGFGVGAYEIYRRRKDQME